MYLQKCRKIDPLRSKSLHMIRYKSSAQLSLEGFAPFCDKLDENNRWVKLGRSLPWDKMAAIYHRSMSSNMGRPSVDARAVIGAMIIKHRLKLTDEETVEMISENVFQQWFCGLSAFTTENIFDPSLFVTLRKRMGVEVFEAMNQAILDMAQGRTRPKGKPKRQDEAKKENHDQDPPAPTHKGELKIDATVAPQKIAFPTDLNLLNEARVSTEAMIDAFCKDQGLKTKPRTYRKLARKAFLAVVRKKRRSRKEIRKAIGQQLRYLRRNLRTIDRLWGGQGTPWPLDFRSLHRLWVVKEVYRQQLHMFTERLHRVDDRVVSLSQPHVRPIVRGKAAVNVEFGAKLNVALHEGVAWLDHLDWNAYNESEWLMHHVERYKKHYGHYPEAVNVDAIYGTRANRAALKALGIRFIGKPLGRPTAESLTAQAKRAKRKEMAQRNHIEGKFGQAKNAYGLNCIAAKRRDTSESWIHAIIMVVNIVALLPKLYDRSGFLLGFLRRFLRNATLVLNAYLPMPSMIDRHNRSYVFIPATAWRNQVAA